MSIGKVRSVLYLAAKLLGDLNAVRRGRIFERILARVKGKILGRLFF
jgi:hypothetical protein